MIRLLKQIILALLLCASVGAQGPGDVLDAKFAALYQWSKGLDEAAITYNDQCAGQKEVTQQCENMRAVLMESIKFYIECALRYSTEGNDCRAKLRPLIIAHSVRLFQFNLDCPGQRMTSEEVAQCNEEAKGLDQEKVMLQKRVDQCEKDINNSPKL